MRGLSLLVAGTVLLWSWLALANLIQFAIPAATTSVAIYYDNDGFYKRTDARMVWVNSGSLYAP